MKRIFTGFLRWLLVCLYYQCCKASFLAITVRNIRYGNDSNIYLLLIRLYDGKAHLPKLELLDSNGHRCHVLRPLNAKDPFSLHSAVFRFTHDFTSTTSMLRHLINAHEKGLNKALMYHIFHDFKVKDENSGLLMVAVGKCFLT